MLVAQAMIEGLVLVTADRELSRYGIEPLDYAWPGPMAGDATAEAIIPDDRIRRRQRTILALLRGAMIADGRCQAAVTVVRRILTVAAARQAAIGSREVGDVLTRRPVRRVRHWI